MTQDVQQSSEAYRSSRPLVVGDDNGPTNPFPIRLSGTVERGFGRGGKDLNCPTANMSEEFLTALKGVSELGIYYGYAQVLPTEDIPNWTDGDSKVLPMVMSLGWNPFYKNEKVSAEIHIMHDYPSDFYGHRIRAILLGYIRPEASYSTLEALIEEIETDKRVGINSLSRPAYSAFLNDPFFKL